MDKGGSMIPAGVERDKVIAIKKGEKVDCDLWPCVDNAFCDEYQGFKCPHQGVKPYSTDIACAMKLELPVNHYEVVRRRNKVQVLCWITLNPEGIHYSSEWHYTEAEAMADARSGAWLKWKEGQGWKR
jgi:hypothetical protein